MAIGYVYQKKHCKGEDEFKYPTVPLEQPAGPLWQCMGGRAKAANKSH